MNKRRSWIGFGLMITLVLGVAVNGYCNYWEEETNTESKIENHHEEEVEDYSDDYLVSRFFNDCESGEITRVKKILTEQGLNIKSKGRNGWTGLHSACRGNQLEMARYLLANGAEINARNKNGNTPLHVATQYHHHALIALLIEKGANIYSEAERGMTPFFEACSHQDLESIKLFIKKGIDINRKNMDETTALMYAIGEVPGVAEILLDYGANPNIKDQRGETALHKACRLNQVELVKRLLAKKADLTVRTSGGADALGVACANGCLEIAELLIGNGASIKTVDPQGRTLLHYACHDKGVGIMDLLLKKGLDINAKDFKGQTVLMLASAAWENKMVEYLIKKGINVKATDNQGMTALHHACYDDTGWINDETKADTIKKLINAGINPNGQDKKGLTPLHLLSRDKAYDLIPVLAQYPVEMSLADNEGNTPAHLAQYNESLAILVLLGGNVNLKNKKGQTAIDPSIERVQKGGWSEDPLKLTKYDLTREERLLFACERQLNLVARILINQGANLNAQNKDGATPLHLIDEPEIAKVLLQKGSKINVQDHQGQTPLMYALKTGNLPKAELFLKKGADPNILDHNGETALDMAFINDDRAVSELVSAHGGKSGHSIRDELKNQPVQSVKEKRPDFDTIRQLVGNYEQALVDAVNNGQFSYVADCLTPGSKLYQTQQNLVAKLSQQKVKEKLLEYQIEEIQALVQNLRYKVWVTEKVGVKKPGNKDYELKTFDWIYTVEVNKKKYTLSSLEKWERKTGR